MAMTSVEDIPTLLLSEDDFPSSTGQLCAHINIDSKTIRQPQP